MNEGMVAPLKRFWNYNDSGSPSAVFTESFSLYLNDMKLNNIQSSHVYLIDEDREWE